MNKITLVTGTKTTPHVAVHYVGAFAGDDSALCGESYAQHVRQFGQPVLTIKRVSCVRCRIVQRHVQGK